MCVPSVNVCVLSVVTVAEYGAPVTVFPPKCISEPTKRNIESRWPGPLGPGSCAPEALAVEKSRCRGLGGGESCAITSMAPAKTARTQTVEIIKRLCVINMIESPFIDTKLCAY